MINPGVVAAIRVVGVRGDPCGAMRSHCTTRVKAREEAGLFFGFYI